MQTTQSTSLSADEIENANVNTNDNFLMYILISLVAVTLCVLCIILMVLMRKKKQTAESTANKIEMEKQTATTQRVASLEVDEDNQETLIDLDENEAELAEDDQNDELYAQNNTTQGIDDDNNNDDTDTDLYKPGTSTTALPKEGKTYGTLTLEGNDEQMTK